MDERKLARHHTLSEEDLRAIGSRRRSETKLGFAVQLCYLRFPGRPLRAGERPPLNLLEYVAAQLGEDPVVFHKYAGEAGRDTTRDGTIRSAAIFVLGYWAGCRVSDVSWLTVENVHVGPKVGWLRVGHKGGKVRDIDLINEARRPLYEYLHHGGRDPGSLYVFTSQRAPRLTEAGIHHWFRKLRSNATKDEWELISDVTFHDLRHDFAHRAREAGWSIEEVAYYLGHITKKGAPAIQTTARYTQVSREEIKEKLKLLRS
jgi:integrase